MKLRRRHSWTPAISLLMTIVAGAAVPSQARADVIPYALSSFTLLNTNADGTVVSPDGGVSAILTGGNNGSGLSGTTDLLTTATTSGTIQFHYLYSSLDSAGFDWAGFLIGGAFTQLVDTDGQFGTASFPVATGQLFGFRVGTFDNTQEPGVFTISSFTAGAPSPVPEPAAGQLLGVAFAAMLAAIGRRRCIRNREKRS